VTIDQFDSLIAAILDYLRKDCKKRPERYMRSGEDFETCVKEGVEIGLAVLGLQGVKISHTLNGH